MAKFTCFKKRYSGFSLIEILIAFSILLFGVIGLARIQVILMRDGNYAEKQAEAVKYSQQKIEELRSFSDLTEFAAMGSGTDTSHSPFTISWSTDVHSDSGYNILHLNTSWQDREGKARVISLDSLIAKYPPEWDSVAYFSDSGVLVPP